MQEWTAAVAQAGTTADGAAVAAAGLDLLRRWREPHRRYHDEAHLVAVLDAVDTLACEAADPSLVRLAAWFHDAVYEGRPGQDELESAELARRVLTELGLPAPAVAAVAALVGMTRTHRAEAGAPYDATDAATLADADLAVLAGEPAAYARYVAAVRAEYAHVPEPQFRTGRAAVLRSLAAGPSIYATQLGRRLWEDRARRNLSAELAGLEG